MPRRKKANKKKKKKKGNSETWSKVINDESTDANNKPIKCDFGHILTPSHNYSIKNVQIKPNEKPLRMK